jgi:hypothetical protein
MLDILCRDMVIIIGTYAACKRDLRTSLWLRQFGGCVAPAVSRRKPLPQNAACTGLTSERLNEQRGISHWILWISWRWH